ncbi:hypothetical protein E3O25_14290 [Cryobacterium sp. TMT1-3]|uniref:Uncharacterized protein n=1 Tax=Cryobacterium luteum TaxID=1424661 RepID=A0A1H8JKB4_9MICO|nr:MULTISPECIES: hypothetical protein [Cryobacterium]TFB83920.1 hypothetical protein E3O10_16720 [Cryobacterium luteum]TFC25166.1 hypothetical protein E3O25_14290 [Cryobacterium sp. TMT1-3]SEN81223.1 hypothetical protein SAMN05216281_11522 [Cryobacterium luteum]
MVAIARTDHPAPIVRARRVSVRWSLAAAGLFLAAAALQLVASLERWVVLTGSWTRTDISIEDHRFDYSYPADPWENLGTTAQFFGLGLLLLALGIRALARSAASRDSGFERMLTVATAASFGITGMHALVSGLMGVPSPLQFLPVQMLLSLIGFAGLIALSVRWLRVSWASSVACLLLLGVTLPGYIVATFQIAPALLGYQSHDTTPFTETIVAVSTAAAGVAMLVAAGMAERSRRRSAARRQVTA